MSDFIAGFAARHAAPPERIARAMAPVPGFAPSAPGRPEPVHFRPQGGPRHFSPADRTSNPTEGWDPLDPTIAEEPVGIDPVEAARADGYAEGLAAATANASDLFARDHALLADIAATLGDAGRIDRAAMADRLRQTVMLLLSRLVGEVGVSPDLLAGRVAAAAELLADASESGLLRVHPDDVALLEGRLPNTIFAAGDAALTRGSFVLESASTIVEDGPELWLEQLARAIDRVPVPASC
ncbi:MAG TPA: FliH/SctL family protein [Sphingomonas sp.]|jgi:flagellar assembly protein FliH|uniref:FliH/SctL family protein n=1 Tax=Sphingomonas sp. TaxID=28214 RepID=UPI002EDAEAE3